MPRPRLAVVATGGTIAGSAASATDATGYSAGTTSVDDLVAGVPALADLADLTLHQFAQLDSSELTDRIQLDLARCIQDLVDDEAVDGVVVTHGTDSLEESAYLLHLVLRTAKPVVLTGAMRPATALGADGPRNLFAAVVAATSTPAGVYVVMDDRLYSGRDVTKVAVDRFGSPHGPLGTVINDRVALYRRDAREHGGLGIPTALPSSAIVTVYPGLETVPAARVLIVASYGNGTIPSRLVPALEAARAEGSIVVRASRTGAGTLTPIGASVESSVNDWVVVDDQSPVRARLLAAIAVAQGHDEASIQELFLRY